MAYVMLRFMSVTEIDVKTHRADFDQLTQTLYETMSRKRAVWNEVKEVFASVNRSTDVIKNTIKSVIRVIISPTGNVIEELSVKIPSVPWAQRRCH
jgi:hypothetical protein